MATAPRVDVMFARAIDEQISEQRSTREVLEEIQERLESVEEALGALESRMARWSDPSEITDEVVGLEEEISVALGRFHKRIDGITTQIEQTVKRAVATGLDPVLDELEALTAELRRVPETLAEQQQIEAADTGKGRRRRRRGED